MVTCLALVIQHSTGNDEKYVFIIYRTCGYACNTGYWMGDIRNVTCQNTGLWSPPPVCTVHDCGSPPSIRNATLAHACTETTYNVWHEKCVVIDVETMQIWL